MNRLQWLSQLAPVRPVRRAALACLLLAGCWPALGPQAQAQQRQPIVILVGLAPGGGVDTIARLIAHELESRLGVPAVVENRPGAGGLMAAKALHGSRPDGRTLLLTNDHALAIIPHVLKNPGYSSPAEFTPVARITDRSVLALAANADSGVADVRSIPQLANGQSLPIGVPAPGSIPAFAVGLIGKALGVEVEPVPYRGGAPLTQDLVAGHVALGLTATAELRNAAKEGQVRLLAVTGRQRHPDYPDIPTLSELGIAGLERTSLLGVFAPPGTPPEIAAPLGEAIQAALQSPRLQEAVAATTGTLLNDGDAEALRTDIQGVFDYWGPIIRESGYQPQ